MATMALNSTSTQKCTALLDLPVDLLLEIFDCLDFREVDRLRLVCKALDTVVVSYQFPTFWECSILHPTCIDNLLRYTQNCPKDRFSCIEFTLDHKYTHDEFDTAPNRDQSLEDAQTQQLTVVRQGGQDTSKFIDFEKIRASLKNLANTSCEILIELRNWSHITWSVAEQAAALRIAHELLYTIVCSNLPLVRLNLHSLPFDDCTLKTLSRGCFDLQDLFKNVRWIYYSLEPWTIDWNQDDNEKILRDRAGVLKALESATNLERLRLLYIDTVPIAAKFLTANPLSSLRSLFLEKVECKTVDLIAAIRKCAATVHQLGLVDVDLDRSASRLELLQTLQDCPALRNLVVFREPILPSSQGTFETLLMEHYSGGGSLGVKPGVQGYVFWETNEEVRKIVDFNIARSKK
ncbi:hypothetical protein HII31_08474 [Pseudocercospora fuligena]|uniref:F-box domain-containing protein n=1 Tax=Pseudocercospora fuligena TaxID=685502 RepID=A0A8H6RFG5_9PEZI|nr:hypothetical protein HII31_08474 [Pseudocercospora fuligena]